MNKVKIYKSFLKRTFDLVISIVALLFFSPLIIIIAFLVKVKLGSPVIYSQKRPGKNEKIFTLYKFRTMNLSVDENGNPLTDNERLTKFGRLLRATSLDELPSLLNILKGDMSLVGPRPLLVEYLPLYNEEQKKRHEVRPGLTGLAQVNGRNSLSWEQKFNFDISYINNITFLTDLKIILMTIVIVIRRKGVNQSETTTMMPFTGDNK